MGKIFRLFYVSYKDRIKTVAFSPRRVLARGELFRQSEGYFGAGIMRVAQVSVRIMLALKC